MLPENMVLMPQDASAGDNPGNKKTETERSSAGTGRMGGEIPKPSGRGRSPRSACNFCHDKRVKCVMADGESRCEQCISRNARCVFSIKGKTGPKPKTNRPKSTVPRHKRKSMRRRRHGSVSGADSSSDIFPARQGAPARGVDAATPVSTDTSTGRKERMLLDVYIRTIGRLVPLVEADTLMNALKRRQGDPQNAAVAVGTDSGASVQAQVVGAISLGALIIGDLEKAQAYHYALRFHIGDVSSVVDPTLAPALVLGAFYWQHQGEDMIKEQWVEQARRMLCDLNEISMDMLLSIEHLDYANMAHVRPHTESLPANRRTLHAISCLLANMTVIVNPGVGRATTVSFCEHLGDCIRDLQNEPCVELPLLLCTSLRTFLLVMLGRRDAAATLLDSVPGLVDAASGGNPDVVRALPLSWDALVIAAALSFLMGHGHVYVRLRVAVEAAMDVPPEARWSFCLPEPGNSPQSFLEHECHSSSNICTIMCEIARKTNFGTRSFFSEIQSLLRPPVAEVSSLCQYERGKMSAMLSDGYGAGGMAMRSTHSNDWFAGGGAPCEGAAGAGSGGVAVVHARADTVSPDSNTQKRRRIIDNEDGASEIDDTWPSERSGDRGPRYMIRCGVAYTATGGEGPFRPAEVEAGPVSEAGEHPVARGLVDDDDALGLTRGFHDMSLSRLSAPLLPGGGVASSVSNEDPGPLGRVPSEGIMDLGSTIGSFRIEPETASSCGNGSAGDRKVAGIQDASIDDVVCSSDLMGPTRRSQRRLSSFSTYHSALCRSDSALRESHDSAGGASGSQSSDLGNEIVVAADDFVDEDGNKDICGKLLSVHAILANDMDSIGPVAEEGGTSATGAEGGGSEGGGGSSNACGGCHSGGQPSVRPGEQGSLPPRGLASLDQNQQPKILHTTLAAAATGDGAP